MQFPQPLSIKELAKEFNARIIGDESLMATGINEIHKVEKGDITFSDVEKYFQKSLKSEASIIILNSDAPCPEGKAILVVDEPFEVYNSLILRFRPVIPLTVTIADTAIIHPTAIIEPNVVVGHHVEIKENVYIQANVTIGEYSIIGKNSIIQSGAIIGTEAFYYKKTKDGYKKWRSGGKVVIGNDVEIGAGCTINKGVSGDTIIGDGTKFDCQIHIGHGAVIGKNCLFAGQVGIGGKTVVEDNVVMYGQVGVAQNLRIGTGAIVLAKSGVSKSLEGGKTYFGSPAGEVRTKFKELAAMRQLPAFIKGKQ